MPRYSMLAFSALVVLTIGCDDDPLSSNTQQSRETQGTIALARVRAGEGAFAQVASEAEEFAGAYSDGEGGTVLLSTAAAGDALVTAAARRHLSTHLGRRVSVRRARFSYRQLAAVRDAILRNEFFDNDDIIEVDLNEVANRVTVGVRGEIQPVRQRLMSRLASLGRDSSIITFVPTDVARPNVARSAGAMLSGGATTLRDSQPPFEGGHQHSQFGTGVFCSVGAVIQRNGIAGYITNSHCTYVLFGLDTSTYSLALSQFRKGTGSVNIGFETVDPSTSSCSGFDPDDLVMFTNKQCRAGDVAFIQLSDSTYANRGAIARTVDVATGWGNSGSIDLNSTKPFRPVVGAINSVLANTYVHKVGRTTGTTAGLVTETCTVRKYTTNGSHYLTCVHRATYYAEDGDSGGSVFTIENGDASRLVGVHWGSNSGLQRSFFSPWSTVSSEIGGTIGFSTTISLTSPSCLGNVSGARPRLRWSRSVATNSTAGVDYAFAGQVWDSTPGGFGIVKYVSVATTDTLYRDATTPVSAYLGTTPPAAGTRHAVYYVQGRSLGVLSSPCAAHYFSLGNQN